MLRSALLALAIGAAPAAQGCDPARAAAAALVAVGRPALRVVDAADGARLAHAGLLLQARGAPSGARSVPGAQAVREGEPLAEAPAGRSFVVVSDEPELALRLGARLAREGAATVAVVAGGLPPWGPAIADSQRREE